MPTRVRLPNRRSAETVTFQHQGLNYTATVGRFDDGRVAEVFLNNGKLSSQSDLMASDAAKAISFALQYGAPFDKVRSALSRDPRGQALSALGAALDLIKE